MVSSQNSLRHPNGFRWMDADAYLFDIDGTLLIARDPVHRNAVYQAMREAYGVDTTIDGIAYHGKTDLAILRAALERVGVSQQAFAARLPQALAVVRREVAARTSQIVPNVCPAVPQVLARLRDAGKLLGVASGNLEVVGWHKIQAAGLREFFRFGCFSDCREARADIFAEAVRQSQQWLGSSATVCFVGDTPEDVKAARHAGAQVIAVCTGIFGPHELAPLAPDLCISSCAELLATSSGR
jgi:phosphoglycolate phosphatase-like HAD superfamily hydrolase